jgi:H+/Cl- antiporter ClcA
VEKRMTDDKFSYKENYIISFSKWLPVAVLVGIISGIAGSSIYFSIDFAARFRMEHDWIIWLLPFAGIVIVFLYRLFKIPVSMGTNQIIDAVRSEKSVPAVIAPLMLISTAITHLFGGSAGRAGAALQIGGIIGMQTGKIFHLYEKDMHIVILCGMSGVFSSLFGTPLTAVIFAMEVISIGVIYYSAFFPCLIASLTAYEISVYLGVKPLKFALNSIPDIEPATIIKVMVLALLCAMVSIIFCSSLKKTNLFFEKIFKNEYMKIAAGGAAVVIITMLTGTRDYNGAGLDIIADAIGGRAKPEAFAMKIILTSLTIGTGFKGGEIMPTFFIGAAFGCAAGGLLGLDPGFGAGIGLVSLFCGAVNCPVASIILSIEIFGADGLIFFAAACSISYVFSGYCSLYSSQKIIYSKIKAEFINIYAK